MTAQVTTFTTAMKDISYALIDKKLKSERKLNRRALCLPKCQEAQLFPRTVKTMLLKKQKNKLDLTSSIPGLIENASIPPALLFWRIWVFSTCKKKHFLRCYPSTGNKCRAGGSSALHFLSQYCHQRSQESLRTLWFRIFAR